MMDTNICVGCFASKCTKKSVKLFHLQCINPRRPHSTMLCFMRATSKLNYIIYIMFSVGYGVQSLTKL